MARREWVGWHGDQVGWGGMAWGIRWDGAGWHGDQVGWGGMARGHGGTGRDGVGWGGMGLTRRGGSWTATSGVRPTPTCKRIPSHPHRPTPVAVRAAAWADCILRGRGAEVALRSCTGEG